ncbi:MAG: prepilin-type N-terminal cleavage/methylation domain-containing protein [Pseudomonadota bacterium]|nr:prepilin-type N-terminal cleavage/methylation domain-containing protein [Pseudomonadota bacterium]
MKENEFKQIAGFTLVELLAAVAIVGVLVTLAMPRYNVFVAKGRQAEAKSNLGTLHKLQEAYYLDTGALTATAAYFTGLVLGVGECNDTTTSKKNKLGFRLSDCANARYLYKGAASATSNVNTAESDKSEKKIYPGCDKDDKWSMSALGQLSQVDATNVIIQCDN